MRTSVSGAKQPSGKAARGSEAGKRSVEAGWGSRIGKRETVCDISRIPVAAKLLHNSAHHQWRDGVLNSFQTQPITPFRVTALLRSVTSLRSLTPRHWTDTVRKSASQYYVALRLEKESRYCLSFKSIFIAMKSPGCIQLAWKPITGKRKNIFF